ncbi:MAG TPA: hypothetical protein VFH03_06065 [Actinoplanes sp.]|nr:hypothetical protein [Actinoplanes sp.]
MWQLNAVVYQLLYQLPLLLVVITGLILVGARWQRLGRRRAALALTGLIALALDVILSTLWSVFHLSVVSPHDFSESRYVTVVTVVVVLLAALTAVGVALLVAAVVAGPDRPGPPRPAR